MIKVGYVFTHQSMLDPGWRPAPGQKWGDAPKAICKVTRVTTRTVYFGYEGDTRGSWSLPRRTFEERYEEGNGR